LQLPEVFSSGQLTAFCHFLSSNDFQLPLIFRMTHHRQKRSTTVYLKSRMSLIKFQSLLGNNKNFWILNLTSLSIVRGKGVKNLRKWENPHQKSPTNECYFGTNAHFDGWIRYWLTT
jgi:hypothetical protein